MELVKVKLLENDNYIKLRLNNCHWNILIANKTILFEAICDLLLDKTNMLFYATQKRSTKTLVETKKFVKKLEKNHFIDDINAVLVSLGWNDDKLNINSTIFQGDLGEYLSTILIDKLKISNTLISKVSLKTSPNMPSFGNDNLFFDRKKKVLYFGEAKFYGKLSDGLTRAVKSLSEHSKGISEISYITTHTSTFIAQNKRELRKTEQIFENLSINDVKIGSISFIIMNDKYKKLDIEKLFIKYENEGKIPKHLVENSYIVILPILSKNEFLKYFKEQIRRRFYEKN